jgi:cell division control protein 7
VLLKCTSQTTKIDIWSAGVILLTLLGRRFPFFHSIDDVDALIEMASIVGQRRMKSVASLHGQVFETTIPTIGERGYTWEKIVKWSSCVDSLTGSEKQGVRLLSRLMELDPHRRISAGEALDDEFFTDPDPDDLAWGGETTKEDGDKAEASKQGDNAANDGTVDGDVDGVDEVQLVQ